MNVRDRLLRCSLIEKMEENRTCAKRLGIENIFAFNIKGIRTKEYLTNNAKEIKS